MRFIGLCTRIHAQYSAVHYEILYSGSRVVLYLFSLHDGLKGLGHDSRDRIQFFGIILGPNKSLYGMFNFEVEPLMNCRLCYFSARLKGLSHEIDFKNVNKNLQN